MAQLSLHPLIDGGLPAGTAGFADGRLACRCAGDRVLVDVEGDVAHNHACGCSKCWKPEGALFAVVGVVATSKLRLVAFEEKLRVVDEAATIRRHACRECGVHMFGRIAEDHAFRGFDFVHVELSAERGWQPPSFAGFVSSIIERGFRPEGMDAVRGRFRDIGLETYDCLSPGLMDAIAIHAAGLAAKSATPPLPPPTTPRLSGGEQRRKRRGGLVSLVSRLFGE